MKKILLGILLFTFFISCSPQKKLNRLIKRNPHLAGKVTIYSRDTIVTQSVSKDTLFSFTNTKDTVILKQDNMTIKYFYDTKTDSVYLKGKCDTVWITRDVPISVTNISSQQSFVDTIKGKLWLIFIILVLLFLLFYKNRR